MTNNRFKELLNGPLAHPLPTLAIARLVLALRAVVKETGAAGDQALEKYCRQREAHDGAEDEFDQLYPPAD